MRKLQAELDLAMPDPRVIPDIAVLQKLPYLNAFIKEGCAPCLYSASIRPHVVSIGLRLYGAAPSLLERVVPTTTCKTGAANEAFDLMGYGLPPGTIVATQGWSMHREASIFPSPDTFLPDRWLEADAMELGRMTQHMMPFGVGSRVCGG